MSKPEVIKLTPKEPYYIDADKIKSTPVVCLPLMRIPAPPEKPTKYLPEVWKPNAV